MNIFVFPEKQIYGFSLTTNEILSRDEFRDSLQKPLAEKLVENGLWKFGKVSVYGTNGDLIRVTDANGNSDYVRDEQGNVVKSHLNENLLQQIAGATGGFYLPLRGADTMDTLYERGLAPLPDHGAQRRGHAEDRLTRPGRRHHEQVLVVPEDVGQRLRLGRVQRQKRKITGQVRRYKLLDGRRRLGGRLRGGVMVMPHELVGFPGRGHRRACRLRVRRPVGLVQPASPAHHLADVTGRDDGFVLEDLFVTEAVDQHDFGAGPGRIETLGG